MSRHFSDWDERTLDLATERFTVGLDRSEEATLDRLAEEADLRDFENTLAAIHLGSLADVETPPAEFMKRLERLGREQVGPGVKTPEREPARIRSLSSRAFAFGGWLAAAVLVLTFVLSQRDDGPGIFAQRETLIAGAGDLVQLEWAATEDPAARGAGGDVVWSSALQEGYMRFQNLAPNDPEQSQYQLWIFDPTRADWEAKPVDGGVFDVKAGGEVIVPIDAKLAVRETALFAVTIEVPGGVVISERERLVLTAAL
jgi:hypothetical protein